MLTVKQLSEKLNVSKQTINNNVPSDMSYKKIKGINYIDEELEIAITNNINRNKNRFSYDSTQSEDIRHENTSSNDELIKQLRSEIEYLKAQINNKDKQIDNRDNQLEQLIKALTNEQSLNLDNKNKITQLENEIANKDKQLIKLDSDSNATHDVSEDNNQSDEAVYTDPSSTSEIHNYSKEDSVNETPHKKKSLLSRLFSK
ncbi:DUF536 domain-containing protein [Staphylococcus saprophyticus]|uniref:DUF536 domain-containing protein n=2 Tax=Staphylococcus TaxID=1279 RepID=UPI0021A44E24|nr:DUF536 domain-containing protein [Staphylococcus saprophyticus]MCT1652863.1 DUF536 domain-containing protein [Staphylococcus saprophyticus]